MPPLDRSEEGRVRLDIEALRLQSATAQGRAFWRSLEELAETPGFQELVENEFPSGWQDPPDRRQFLKLIAAPLALAGMTACSGLPERTIVPYVRQPEQCVAGRPSFYATAMPMGHRALGILVESHLGRPTKVEGNPDHPSSLGGTDVFAQGAVLTLWDPDRSQSIVRNGQTSDWSAFLAAADEIRAGLHEKQGGGFRVLTETVLSPTLAWQIEDLLNRFPNARWYQYEPVNRDAAREGALMAFGQDVQATYRFDRAETILSLDSDFLSVSPGYARQFALRRNPDANLAAPMSRLYVAETMPTATGSIADHRLRMRASEVELFARAIAGRLGIKGVDGGGPVLSGEIGRVVAIIGDDLKSRPGASLVIPGEFQPPVVHALAHLMNHALGNAGKTVVYTDPSEPKPVTQMESIEELVQEMRAGAVDVLLILGGNPAYTVPRTLAFGEALAKVPLKIHSGLYEDETSKRCDWHIPRTHFLEEWSDVRSHDGTATIIQPLIAPLYGGKSDHEIVATLSEKVPQPALDIIRGYWRRQTQAEDFDKFWSLSLESGTIRDSALPAKAVAPKANLQPFEAVSNITKGTDIVFRPDPTVWDGRFANNGWLQELPKPITTLTWDNAAMMSPATAERFRLANEDVVELKCAGRTVDAPVWIVPGHADDAVTVHLGYGRKHSGRIGTGIGFDAYELRTPEHPWSAGGLEIRKTGRSYRLAARQHEQTMQGRNLVRTASLEHFRSHPNFAREEPPPPPGLSLFPAYQYNGYAWAMAIDLNVCTGCKVCTIACQAENNTPVVGKDQVLRGRAMHWIRVDTYFHGHLDNPQIYSEPVPCMQCENAPCELVCPVGATTHSEDGLNQMVYNRCVGTRYCSNNCPYKVRRFNFLQFADWETPSLKGVRNPDVTVRSRGVMEKCTYCVQRIQEAKIEVEKQDRTVRDGEILTACQQACPTQAIIFGNVNDPKSRVAACKTLSRNYGLLEELNTRPRTTYMARTRNVNPVRGES
jgi:MoCo/4Fe-4S cofactor protein with predicted Tat translocation signal